MHSWWIEERRQTGQKKRLRCYWYIGSYCADRTGAYRIHYQQRYPTTDPNPPTAPFPEPGQWGKSATELGPGVASFRAAGEWLKNDSRRFCCVY